VHNDEQLTQTVNQLLTAQLSAQKVVALPLRMTADDFSFYTHKIPGCYIRIGTTSKDGKQFTSTVHTNTFDIDESAIATGIEVICTLVNGFVKV
jgi:metal-dependent amidase/aminoacylase/carboxypeptidase family protein